MADAHEADGLALATFFCWFEKQLLANARAAGTDQQQQQQQQQRQECILTEWTLMEAVDFAREYTVINIHHKPNSITSRSSSSNCSTQYSERKSPVARCLIKIGVFLSVGSWHLYYSYDFSCCCMLTSKSDLFRGPSFTSISCFGSNCALAHYR